MKNKKIAVNPIIIKTTLIYILLVIHGTGSLIIADDGSWSKSFTIAGGSIYSEEDNENIVLEKELLVFDGKTTRAAFQFRNISDEEMKITCGFPVVHLIKAYMIENNLEIPEGAYGSVEIPGISFFETLPHPYYTEDEPIYAYPEVLPLSEFNNSRNFIEPGEAADADVDFRIEQDGEYISIDKVLVERKADKTGAELTFHFRHDLLFEPNSISVVVVEYSQDLFFGSDGPYMDNFRWNYVIGTGGTWRGPIGEFFLIKPAGWTGEISGLKRIYPGTPISGNPGKIDDEADLVEIYFAEEYEPPRDADFQLRYSPQNMMEQYEYRESFPGKKSIWMNKTKIIPLPVNPAQDYISEIRASSFLADRLSVFTNSGVIESAGFGPEAAFDGLEVTSWCEAAPGNGEGEYIEAVLEEPAAGLVIRNGFKRAPFDDWIFKTGDFERYYRDDAAKLKDYFTMNSRVKVLDIETDNGEFITSLNIMDQRDPQVFYGLDLRPGTYRFIIREVYPGSRWEDTCLGEITIIPQEQPNNLTGNELEKLFTDPFFRKTLSLIKF